MKTPSFFLIQSFLLLILIVTAGSSTVQAETHDVPYVKNSKVVVDGVIGLDEYGSNFLDNTTGISVHWEHNGTHIRLGLISRGSGWVSIGLGPRLVEMNGANIILGFVNDSNRLSLFDEIGVGRNHFPDVERGGKDDIVNKAGSLKEGRLQVEFIFPLNSGDSLDQSFQTNNTYGFFLGDQEIARDRSTYHSAHSATYDLFIEHVPEIIPQGPPIQTFQWNYVLWGFGFVLIVIIVVNYVNRPKVIRFKKN